jgi:hypothetical protein
MSSPFHAQDRDLLTESLDVARLHFLESLHGPEEVHHDVGTFLASPAQRAVGDARPALLGDVGQRRRACRREDVQIEPICLGGVTLRFERLGKPELRLHVAGIELQALPQMGRGRVEIALLEQYAPEVLTDESVGWIQHRRPQEDECSVVDLAYAGLHDGEGHHRRHMVRAQPQGIPEARHGFIQSPEVAVDHPEIQPRRRVVWPLLDKRLEEWDVAGEVTAFQEALHRGVECRWGASCQPDLPRT